MESVTEQPEKVVEERVAIQQVGKMKPVGEENFEQPPEKVVAAKEDEESEEIEKPKAEADPVDEDPEVTKNHAKLQEIVEEESTKAEKKTIAEPNKVEDREVPESAVVQRERNVQNTCFMVKPVF